MPHYPIIDQRSLPKAERRGLKGILPARRAAGELPLPNAHEAVVYKTAGSYIVDDGQSRTTDDHIVNATNITVVDMREDAPIQVRTSIPSAGEVEFVVHVTFLCAVKKPEEVADAGLQDITASLTNYLIQHQQLFHLGEDYHLNQINVVRRNVTAEVKAFFSVRPPRFRGLDVRLGNVRVMTPDELREKQRELEMETLLTSGQQQTEHRLAEEKAALEEIRRRNDEAFELERRLHTQKLEQMQQQLTQMQRTHEQVLRTASFQHAASETQRLKDALGVGETEMGTLFAGAAGERSMSETVDALNAGRERRGERGADDELRKQTWAREDAVRREAWDREDTRAGREIDRENARMHYDLEVVRFKAQAEALVAGIRRGLADDRNIDEVTSALNGVVKSLESASASTAARPDAGQGTERVAHDGPDSRAGDGPREDDLD